VDKKKKAALGGKGGGGGAFTDLYKLTNKDEVWIIAKKPRTLFQGEKENGKDWVPTGSFGTNIARGEYLGRGRKGRGAREMALPGVGGFFQIGKEPPDTCDELKGYLEQRGRKKQIFGIW